jgi:hypothetical protein
MSSTLVMDRGALFGQQSIGGAQPTQVPQGLPNNWCVLPRCEVKFEKCAGGFKIHCCCDDDVACGALQNLCKMLAGGTCSCCVCCNGVQICNCNLTLGFCKCELTSDGCCITCTSGDKQCCEMLQSCCDCLACCCKQEGCCCYISFGGTPICCGTC